MKNYIRSGNTINYTNATGAAIVSGQFIPVGSLFGVAETDIAINDTQAVKTTGVYAVTKDANAIAFGAKVYWDGTAKVLTATSTSNTFVGFCTDAALAGDATVNVVLANGI